MNLIREINNEEYGKDKEAKYTERKAARAVVFNDDKKIAVMNVSNDGYHKLPGGGVEEDEDIMDALKRELLEEVGVEVNILDQLGMIIEKRYMFKQTSYCYIVEAVGEYKGTAYTEDEINNGFILEWMDLDTALSTLEADKPLKDIGIIIRERDLSFLRYFKENFNK